jgi:hypothetical protein
MKEADLYPSAMEKVSQGIDILNQRQKLIRLFDSSDSR